ncbi:MAG: hypothetical protein FD189_2192 [Elusimicrobia bacterium]|nr:MAG: hypothetical protein FD154_2282 [Elusimicrobiota bacterium]KAF0153916.1 MAG: hypothetical protein FD189_2192 [Elusimicrobiota bacterium]
MKKIIDLLLKLDAIASARLLELNAIVSTRRTRVLAGLLLGLSALAVLSQYGSSTKILRPRASDPLWRNYISAHTSGLVSRKSNIRIEFLTDVFPQEAVGQSASPIVAVEPSVGGEYSISGTREITIVPGKDLERGRHYLVRVKGGKIDRLPAGIGDYEFAFQVLEQAMELDIRGLAVSAEGGSVMELGGVLLTADAEVPGKVEEVLAASFDGDRPEIRWSHDPSGKRHEFIVTGIARREGDTVLALKWDGSGIGAREKGGKDIEVPGTSVFKVTEVKPIQDAQQYILVYFSDKLRADQAVRGLVTLDQSGYTVRVENNMVKVYPEKRFVGKVTVTLEPGLRNEKGAGLRERVRQTVVFASQKPQVRFAGKGVILPENKVLMIPVEAVNIRSVQVTAFKIFDNNVGQFLQANKLDGSGDLKRVGRYLWRKTIHLPSIDPDRWQRYNLDATELLRKTPRGIFRLELSINRKDSTYSCSEQENAIEPAPEAPFADNEDLYARESSYWDSYGQEYDPEQQRRDWHDRADPCKDAYYRHAQGVSDVRSFMASNIGLLAKRDQSNRLFVSATDLATSAPLDGVRLSARNFQNQEIGAGVTDGSGFAELALSGVPFYLEGRKGDDAAYLKLNAGTAIPVTHFDVGGEEVREGIKGVIYGERDVWRPGDELHLVFALENKGGVIPADHPVTMLLRNPKGQVIHTLTNNRPVGGFYRFSMKTDENAATGNWTAEARIGGRVFSRQVKVETVKPNRLKIEARFDDDEIYSGKMPVQGVIESQWLHGASAAGLKADAEVQLRPVPTRFDRFSDHVFDDPTREFKGQPETLFEGALDGRGRAVFNASLSAAGRAPGKLAAGFRIRVFESGGDFSSTRLSVPFSPYPAYVGIKLPEGDAARGMLLTDVPHKVSIATLSDRGKPVPLKNVRVSLYRLDWRWWWDKSEESLARFAAAESREAVKSDVVSTSDGAGTWDFEIKYPTWGRYMVKACDESGGHCSARVFYIDWPGWAGRAQEEGGAGANVLSFFSDKREYTVGEKAVIQLPEVTQGRALLTVETGSGILERRWLEFAQGKSKFELPITAGMSPNAYVSVALIQPHQGKNNDRPIRLYGVIPLLVRNPETALRPVIGAAEEWRPETRAQVKVSEAGGRPMDYTLAVVDEGLLGLTNFRTPDLHGHFYKKEALGITTWDLYDYVVGAYGAELERLLALGGDEGLDTVKKEDERRFPPVVRFLGPFSLGARGTNTHEVELPAYMGAVRVMVVAGRKGAYGKAEKTVVVKEPLGLLTTLPRVIGPGEEITVPVTVFSSEDSIKDVTLKLEAGKYFEPAGGDTATAVFSGPGEKMVFFRVKSGQETGAGTITVSARGGAFESRSVTALTVRSPNPPTSRQYRGKLEPGETWTERVVPHGLKGTNEISLEVASVPPLNLEKRLTYLIRYPHGCAEQVTSSVFPQLYLPGLVKLDENRKKEIEKNVNAGIDRLRQFQSAGGGFVYWPGGGSHEGADSWASNYAGHYLTEAREKGYFVPPAMHAEWLKYQRSAAQVWSPEGGGQALDQSYRLYTLALAGEPEIGSMNRLKEAKNLPDAARWQLAAAYHLAGMKDAARDVAEGAGLAAAKYVQPGATFGSELRDKAIILDSLAILGRYDNKALAEEISSELSSERTHSTQSLAYALMAAARYYGASGEGGPEFRYAAGAGEASPVKSDRPVVVVPLELPQAGAEVRVWNTSDRRLFAAVTVRGVAPAGEETEQAAGLSMRVHYSDKDGNALDVTQLPQGADVIARVTVSNTSGLRLENIALTHMSPSGWEIHNSRLDSGQDTRHGPLDYQDIRDDRVYSYFSLPPGAGIEVVSRFNAAYLGRYYMPGIYAEAMYEAGKRAQTKGKWVTVTKPSK